MAEGSQGGFDGSSHFRYDDDGRGGTVVQFNEECAGSNQARVVDTPGAVARFDDPYGPNDSVSGGQTIIECQLPDGSKPTIAIVTTGRDLELVNADIPGDKDLGAKISDLDGDTRYFVLGGATRKPQVRKQEDVGMTSDTHLPPVTIGTDISQYRFFQQIAQKYPAFGRAGVIRRVTTDMRSNDANSHVSGGRNPFLEPTQQIRADVAARAAS